ncbi:hypothetical protein BDZ45DRAFT_752228 [Acephala macrosclerotiorum]|nr:hypothetical protein BDZ45DRAFT_752228 [Acephala macrosclerotiorum]
MLSSFEVNAFRHAYERILLHDRALLNMIKDQGPEGLQYEVDRGVFYSTYSIEIRENSYSSQHQDRTMAAAGDLDFTTQVTMRTLTKIPRLMKLVQSACRDPTNDTRLQEAIELAKTLYNDDLKAWVSYVLADFTKIVPTSRELSAFSPESFHFDFFRILEIINRYWTCRIFLFGLIQTFFAFTPQALAFNLLTIQTKEFHCANTIAMTTDYAFGLSPPLQQPLGALLPILPLQISFGASFGARHRCQKREACGGGSELYSKTICMKDWRSRKSNEVLGLWDWFMLDMDNLEKKLEAFMGGNVEP